MRRWLLLLGMLLAGWAGPALAQQRVRCESFNYQPRSCPVADPQYVRLAERLGGRCAEGIDWTVERRGLLVRNGCRAIFEIGRPSPGPGFGGGPYPGVPGPGYPGGGYPGGIDRVTCQSWNYQPARCAMNTARGVQISRVLGGDCREGATWSYDRGSVSVRGGCRAEFVSSGRPGFGGPGNGGPGFGGGQVIECSSWDYRPARCPIAVARDVELIRVIGGECIERRSWSWDRRGISVRDGCRARFRVY